MSSFFTELKRRSVFRVGAAYLVAGWILLQVADALFPALNLPDWTTRFVVGLVVLGFPVALLIAWAFEVTPEGVKRDSGEALATESSSKRLNVATLIGVAIVIVLFVWQQLNPTIATKEVAQEKIASDIALTSAAPSVAVLAFENMSPDPENAFFAEGISEEILNVLAGVSGLQVASRTSAFSFANTDTPIPEIASKLSVNHVLEGSVRKQGMRVRITAQLIDAENDKHLWSDTYDRELTDIFVVQEEIARAISTALLGVIGMSEISVDAPTKDFVAYELFLSGRKLFYLRGHDELEASIRDLSAAVARDPTFAEAWSYLAAAQSTSIGYGDYIEAEIQARNALASESAAKALELDPTQALAVAIQGQILGSSEGVAAINLLRRAADMAPNDAGLLMWLAEHYFRVVGDLSESLALYERALALDPLSGINQGVAGIAYLMAGKRERGRELIESATEAGWGAASDMLLMDLLHTGEGDRAVAFVKAHFDRIIVDHSHEMDYSREEVEQLLAIWQRISTGKITGDELEEIEATFQAQHPDFLFSMEFFAVSDLDRYFDRWLDAKNSIGLQFHLPRLAYGPAGIRIVEHPRYMEVARRLHLFPVWEEFGYPFECELVNDDIGEHLSCANWPE